MTNNDIRKSLSALSEDYGFEKFGIVSNTGIDENVKDHVKDWVSREYAAGMDWYKKSLDIRFNVKNIFAETSSALVFLHSYYHDSKNKWQSGSQINIAHYAAAKDYHKVLKKKLRRLMEQIQPETGAFKYRICVDSAPVLERYFAVKAGLGWIGKNSMHISPEMGSTHFIAVVLTDLKLNGDEPLNRDLCGKCNACISACPTGAILPGKKIDSNRCISYLTIEHDDEVSPKLRDKLNNWAFGCDICVDVCPWNSKKIMTGETRFHNQLDVNQINSLLSGYSAAKFNEVFAGTPLRRAGAEHFKRILTYLGKIEGGFYGV